MSVSSVKNLNGDTFSAVQDLELTNLVQSNSGSWNSKLDATAFSDVSGTFLTAINIPESASWGEATTTVQTNSSTWNTVSDKLDTTAFSTVSADLVSVSSTVNSNSASWGGGGGGGSYTSPSSTIWISDNKIESTDSAYIPTHPEDVLLTATTSWSSINGYNTLVDTNKVFFRAQGNRVTAYDNEGTFLNSATSTPVWAETENPPIKLYTTTWVSVQFSAYSAGTMDAYVVELARKNDVNSALNKKLDSSAFTGYYPSNNPSGFAKTSDVVLPSSFNLFDGRVVGVNRQYLMGCDSAYNGTLVATSAAAGSKTASAYVGTGHQGIDIQVSARNDGYCNINWTAFSENGSNLSAGGLYFVSNTANRISALEFNSPIAENISGVKLFGTNVNFTAYSAYTIDVKPLASQSNITFLSGAIDYVSANAGGGGGSVTLPITGTDGSRDMMLYEYGLHLGVPEGSTQTTIADYSTYMSLTTTDSDNTMTIAPGYVEIGDSTSTATINAQSIRDLTSVSGTVNANSASWGGGQISLSSLNDAGINNIIITASLPSPQDVHTLYLIPET